jgi:hypothetical protein
MPLLQITYSDELEILEDHQGESAVD